LIAVAITAGASRVASDPLCVHAIAITPAGTTEPVSLVLLRGRRPSPKFRRVGSCITLYEACSAFTRVTACTLAESPKATLYTEGFADFVTSIDAPIATGWSEPVPGRV